MKGLPLSILLNWGICNALVISDPSQLKRDSPLEWVALSLSCVRQPQWAAIDLHPAFIRILLKIMP